MQKMKSRFAAAALALALSASLAQPALAWDTKAVTRTNLADENLAPGIHYTETAAVCESTTWLLTRRRMEWSFAAPVLKTRSTPGRIS